MNGICDMSFSLKSAATPNTANTKPFAAAKENGKAEKLEAPLDTFVGKTASTKNIAKTAQPQEQTKLQATTDLPQAVGPIAVGFCAALGLGLAAALAALCGWMIGPALLIGAGIGAVVGVGAWITAALWPQ